MSLTRAELERVLYRGHDIRRFTQDSPVLPDVWLGLAEHDNAWNEPIDVLLTPYEDSSPRELAERILRANAQDGKRRRPERQRRARDAKLEISLNSAYVVGKFYFDEIVRVLLPLTNWWQRHVAPAVTKALTAAEQAPRTRRSEGGLKPERGVTPKDYFALSTPEARQNLKDAVEKYVGTAEYEDLAWLVEVIGRIEWEHRFGSGAKGARKGGRGKSPRRLAADPDEQRRQWAEVGLELLDGLPLVAKEPPSLWMVNVNRPIQTVIWRSVPAIKADAAVRLFDISCRKLRWAVIDSGIDARHIAFRTIQPSPDQSAAKLELAEGDWSKQSRVVETYDFTKLRDLLKASEVDKLNKDLLTGRSIEWKAVAEKIRIPHLGNGDAKNSKYRRPGHRHGTHVAGILAGDWRQRDNPPPPSESDLRGVCPDLLIYDLRVLDDEGAGDEFAILAALQFVRWLNGNREELAIHGVNLSLSLLHDVMNFACGRTPVCDECDRLVNSGVVVVAAAGNKGYSTFHSARGDLGGYRAISITDPGNADEVLTVGATHRFKPHMYGVSYFSSRGPTGDGRIKPDLVAPGEKIKSLIPDNQAETMDGTSMAAPHVSGAAALLMAKHLELIGNPRKIKSILCATATDLGRERHFQGAGMLDVLRALQSV